MKVFLLGSKETSRSNGTDVSSQKQHKRLRSWRSSRSRCRRRSSLPQTQRSSTFTVRTRSSSKAPTMRRKTVGIPSTWWLKPKIQVSKKRRFFPSRTKLLLPSWSAHMRRRTKRRSRASPTIAPSAKVSRPLLQRRGRRWRPPHCMRLWLVRKRWGCTRRCYRRDCYRRRRYMRKRASASSWPHSGRMGMRRPRMVWRRRSRMRFQVRRSSLKMTHLLICHRSRRKKSLRRAARGT
mmetsp:Transcript_8368/g.21063  ORF Transcript_8368/g.21063 Transcript_8368/m.21063 type:complete len:236 (+) Transcript_8368:106-813(+)